MIDIKEIEEEIKCLEEGETSYGNIQKLSWLYTVREHYAPKMQEETDEEIGVEIEDIRVL